MDSAHLAQVEARSLATLTLFEDKKTSQNQDANRGAPEL
jgi:hypothetical protein